MVLCGVDCELVEKLQCDTWWWVPVWGMEVPLFGGTEGEIRKEEEDARASEEGQEEEEEEEGSEGNGEDDDQGEGEDAGEKG